MADALVAADLDLAADVRGDLAAQVTLNLEIGLDVVAELDQLLVREVLGALVQVNRGSSQCLDGTGTTDAEDVGERDLHPLLAGKIDADDASFSTVIDSMVAKASEGVTSGAIVARPSTLM